MPDLNLIDEGEFEEAQAAPVAPPEKKSGGSSGGGGGKTILILIVVLCIVAAGVFYLNQRGVIKIWGKKQQPIAQVQEEQYPPEVPAQPAQVQKQPDTTEVPLLETTPTEEKSEIGKEAEKVKEPEVKAVEPVSKSTIVRKKSTKQINEVEEQKDEKEAKEISEAQGIKETKAVKGTKETKEKQKG